LEARRFDCACKIAPERGYFRACLGRAHIVPAARSGDARNSSAHALADNQRTGKCRSNVCFDLRNRPEKLWF
jgi:hypothetical protein